MKKVILLIVYVLVASFTPPQKTVFDDGEFFKFRISYGVVNAGYATLDLKEKKVNGKTYHHAVGKGWTTGVSKFFFKVDDRYESIFDKTTGLPIQARRKIYEGGYVKDQEFFFDHATRKVKVKDYKRKEDYNYAIPTNSLDVISMFYYLRNHPDLDNIKPGEAISTNMFFDDELIKFRLRFLGYEDVSTKFGTIQTMKFRPLVQSGRVFKEEESVSIWISNDENRVPVRLKASLVVGSLKADLESYKGLSHPLKTK